MNSQKICVQDSSGAPDYSAMYREEIAHSKLKVTAITEALPVSLSEYFAIFLDDKAPHSYSR